MMEEVQVKVNKDCYGKSRIQKEKDFSPFEQRCILCWVSKTSENTSELPGKFEMWSWRMKENIIPRSVWEKKKYFIESSRRGNPTYKWKKEG